MKVKTLPNFLAPVANARAELAQAHTAPLIVDDYERASRSPSSCKYIQDGATFGTSRCLRRASSRFAEGRTAAGVGFAAAIPFTACAAAIGGVLYGVGPVFGALGAQELGRKGVIKRTDRGVREDKVWRAVAAMRAALEKTTSPETKFAIRKGDVTLEELKAMCVDARACSKDAYAASQSWAEGPPRPEFEEALAALDRALDALDKKFARWAEKLGNSAA